MGAHQLVGSGVGAHQLVGSGVEAHQLVGSGVGARWLKRRDDVSAGLVALGRLGRLGAPQPLRVRACTEHIVEKRRGHLPYTG